MIRLPNARDAWGTPEFETVLKREIAQFDATSLPLQQALSVSSHVTEGPIQAMILRTGEDAGQIRVKAGIFYTGIIAGCSCTDDPTPMSDQNEYCVVEFVIDPATANTTVTLLAE